MRSQSESQRDTFQLENELNRLRLKGRPRSSTFFRIQQIAEMLRLVEREELRITTGKIKSW